MSDTKGWTERYRPLHNLVWIEHNGDDAEDRGDNEEKENVSPSDPNPIDQYMSFMSISSEICHTESLPYRCLVRYDTYG